MSSDLSTQVQVINKPKLKTEGHPHIYELKAKYPELYKFLRGMIGRCNPTSEVFPKLEFYPFDGGSCPNCDPNHGYHSTSVSYGKGGEIIIRAPHNIAYLEAGGQVMMWIHCGDKTYCCWANLRRH